MRCLLLTFVLLAPSTAVGRVPISGDQIPVAMPPEVDADHMEVRGQQRCHVGSPHR